MVIAPSDQMSYVSSESIDLDFTREAQRVDVALVRIDDIIPPDSDVYLFKSDAQGYDLNVFLGAERLFEGGRVRMVNTEFTPKVMQAFGEGSPMQLLDFLHDHDFLCFDWAEHQHIPRDRPSTFEGFVSSFNKACPQEAGCTCQDNFCMNESLGKWDELVCVSLTYEEEDR